MKKLVWLGSSRHRIQSLPDICKLAGKELYRVQTGMMPTDWKSLPDIGTGTFEIRIHRPNEYRILYVARYPEAIYVLHVFEKKTSRTSELDKQLGRQRYASLQELRKKIHHDKD